MNCLSRTTIFAIQVSHVVMVPSRYTIMSQCWEAEPSRRPKFSDLAHSIEELLSTSTVRQVNTQHPANAAVTGLPIGLSHD